MEPSPRRHVLRASHSYRPVLALIVVGVLFLAFAPDARWARGVLMAIEAVTLAVALWTSYTGARLRLRLLVVLGAAVLGTVQLFTSEPEVTSAASALNGLLVVAIAVVIARGVLTSAEVNPQAVVGAICIYLLAGLFFTFLYTAIAVQGSGDLFAQGTDGTTADRLYFSFTTLTTVGYGDFSIVGDLGHMLAVTEALTGQLYLVTVVALLVSRMRPARRPGDALED